METIRKYEESDTAAVGILIADTYSELNLPFVTGVELERFLGPFHYARSKKPIHQKANFDILRSPMMYVAEVDGRVIGVLRGREGRLASLFCPRTTTVKGLAAAWWRPLRRRSGC